MSASKPPVSLIGQALVKEGVITQAQIDRALKIQSHLEQHRQLGEILVEMGIATRQAINDVVAKYGKSMRIGDILVEQGILTRDQLDQALKVKSGTDKPIGQVLIELGFINERTLLRNLAHQAQVPYIEPNFAMIDDDVLSGVSPDFLERNLFVPFSRMEDGRIMVVVTELNDANVTQAIEEVFQSNVAIALGPEESIKKTISEYRRLRVEKETAKTQENSKVDDSITALVNHIFSQAIEDGASDIHVEPMADRIRLRFRMDGVLALKSDLPRDLLVKLVSRIKIMADCNITEQRRHQGGRIIFRHESVEYDLRLSCYVTVHGECVVLRVLNKSLGLVGLDELGMSPNMLERYRADVLEPPTGVVIITGPTGSGKTTSLYSSLDYCNEIDRKIITVEDPVEFTIDGMLQCSVFDKVGRTFESSLREIVRQDPDIIVLGEIRDKTTAETAIQAALTGHKVYSTFHTEDTIGGLVRLMNMEIEAFLISSTVISVLAQRLLRRICPDCSTPHQPGSDLVRRLGLSINEVRQHEYTKSQGCTKCNFTGYRGRIAVYELLVMNDAVKESILALQPAHVIRKISAETTGLISMREDGVAKVVQGLTTFDEVLKHTPKTLEMRSLSQILTMTQ